MASAYDPVDDLVAELGHDGARVFIEANELNGPFALLQSIVYTPETMVAQAGLAVGYVTAMAAAQNRLAAVNLSKTEAEGLQNIARITAMRDYLAGE